MRVLQEDKQKKWVSEGLSKKEMKNHIPFIFEISIELDLLNFQSFAKYRRSHSHELHKLLFFKSVI